MEKTREKEREIAFQMIHWLEQQCQDQQQVTYILEFVSKAIKFSTKFD